MRRVLGIIACLVFGRPSLSGQVLLDDDAAAVALNRAGLGMTAFGAFHWRCCWLLCRVGRCDVDEAQGGCGARLGLLACFGACLPQCLQGPVRLAGGRPPRAIPRPASEPPVAALSLGLEQARTA